jgi:large subunit ribosomal protein L11
VLLREAAGLETASQTPGREVIGSITDAQLTSIAETKMPDLNALDIDAAKLQVAGTARSMGIELKG